MKIIPLFAACSLALGAVVARADTYVKAGSATIVRVTGSARYSTDNGGHWYPLVVGKILGANTVLETADGSTVDAVLSGRRVAVLPPQVGFVPQQLSMSDDPNVRGWQAYTPRPEQNVIRLGPGTVLSIDQLTVDNTGADTVSDTELDLRAGKIFTSVKKMSASSKYFIKYPNGVAGIRGTALSIEVLPDGNIVIDCLSGSVMASWTIDGVTYTTSSPLEAGQSLVISPADPGGVVGPMSPATFAAGSGVIIYLQTVDVSNFQISISVNETAVTEEVSISVQPLTPNGSPGGGGEGIEGVENGGAGGASGGLFGTGGSVANGGGGYISGGGNNGVTITGGHNHRSLNLSQ